MINDSDYTYLYSKQVVAFQLSVRPWLLSCPCRVKPNEQILTIDASLAKVSEIETHLEEIGEQAYLKLGCTKTEVYCWSNLLLKYTRSIGTNKISSDMSSTTLERPIEAVASTPTNTSSDWASLETVAQAMPTSIEQVKELIERFNIPLTLRSGELGLDRANAEQFSNQYDFYAKQQRMERMFGATTPAMPEEVSFQVNGNSGSNGSAPPEIEAEVLETAAPSSTPASGQWTMPEGFSPMGRGQRVATTLKKALASLPGGEQGISDRLADIQLRKPEAMQFVESVAALYRKPAEALNELRTAAGDLYDKMMSAKTA